MFEPAIRLPTPGHQVHLRLTAKGTPSGDGIETLTFRSVAKYNLDMRVDDIIWLPHVIDKLEWKHHVSQAEVESILFGRALFRKVQKGHIRGEDVYSAMGQTDAGRYLVVFFVYKQSREALILTARDLDSQERRQYEHN